jgi:hypothetical protein
MVLTLVSSFTFLIFCSSRVAHGRSIQLNTLLSCWMHIVNREKKPGVGCYGSMSRLFMLTRLLKIVWCPLGQHTRSLGTKNFNRYVGDEDPTMEDFSVRGIIIDGRIVLRILLSRWKDVLELQQLMEVGAGQLHKHWRAHLLVALSQVLGSKWCEDLLHMNVLRWLSSMFHLCFWM